MEKRLTTMNPEIKQRYDFMMESTMMLGEVALSMIRNREIFKETKPDGTVVTTADVRLNELFIDRVEGAFDGDLVWGEERSNAEKNNPALANQNWMWLIDPIDGTSGFWRSYQNERFKENTSSIMVTGFAPGETVPTMSVIHNPFQKQSVTISAHSGHTFYQTSDAPIPSPIKLDHRRAPRSLSEVARFEQTDWRNADQELSDARLLIPRARLADHQLFMGSVALGDVDLSLFPGPSNPHDVAPGALILHNAGGAVRTFSNETFEQVDWRLFPVNGTVGAGRAELAHAAVNAVMKLQAAA